MEAVLYHPLIFICGARDILTPRGFAKYLFAAARTSTARRGRSCLLVLVAHVLIDELSVHDQASLSITQQYHSPFSFGPSRERSSGVASTAIHAPCPVFVGHRRLLEHLSDPACPSIRRFVENFPDHLKLDSDVGGGEEFVVTTGPSEEGGSGGKIVPDYEATSTAETLREAYNACLRSLCDFR